MSRQRAQNETASLRSEGSQTARSSGSGSFFSEARNLAINDGQFNSVRGHHTNLIINLNPNTPTQSSLRNRTTSSDPSTSSHRNTRPPLNSSSSRENNRSQANTFREGRPRVPENADASSQLPVQQSNVIYQRHLELKGRGFPLWIPPANQNLPVQYRRTGVRIGDVGIITPDGGFSFLFNICLPHDDPINPRVLPEHFSPIFPPIEATSIDKFLVFGHGSHLASASIEKAEANNSQFSGFQFESSASEGAILTMPLGATSENLGDIAKFRRYAASNIVHWYKFVNGILGREAKNGDIRLVVGCDKTTTWGIATFANQSHQSNCRLRFGLPAVPSSDSISSNGSQYVWEYSGIADVRAGPSPGENNGLSQVDDSGDVVYENQCLFLRTLNTTLREDIWSDIHCDSSSIDLQLQSDFLPTKDSPSTASSINRTSATKNMPSTLSSHTSGNRRSLDPHSESQTNIVAFDGNSVIFDSDPLPTLISHPSKALNDILLAKVPAAHMVITHDEDWSLVASECDTFPDAHELLEKILVSHCICREDGVVFLDRRKAIRSGVSNAQELIPENLGAEALSASQTLLHKSSRSTFLATVCTLEAVADNQARRATGSLTSPALRYLYTERPTSPTVAGFQSAPVPIISNPTSGTTSLPLIEPARPPVPKPVIPSSITRRRPPKRKLLLPEELLQNAHESNKTSSSTTHQSSPTALFLKTAAHAPSELGVAHKLEEGESEDRPRTSSPASSVTSPLSFLLQQQVSQSVLNPPSFAAVASSSLSTLKVAAASTSLSIAAAMRNTRGVLRRGLDTSKDNDSVGAENEDGDEFSDALEINGTSGADGDDNLSVPAGSGGKRAWRRPRFSSDMNQQPRISLTSSARRVSFIKKSTQVSLNTQGSASQDSLDSESNAATASRSVSGIVSGLTGVTKYIKKPQYSGSVTSLESILEAEGTAGLPSHPYTMASNYASPPSPTASSNKPSATPVRPPYLTQQHQRKSLDLSMWSEALLSGISKSTDLNLSFTFGQSEKGAAEGRKGRRKEKDRDSWDGEDVTENAVGVKETEKEEDDKELGSSLASARPLGYPPQAVNTNMSATAAGPSQRQPARLYPVPAKLTPPIFNSKASSSTWKEQRDNLEALKAQASELQRGASVVAPLQKLARMRKASKANTPSAIPSPLSRPPTGLIGHPRHHYGYGNFPKPPPVVRPPPLSAVPKVFAYASNNNNTIVTSAAMAVRGIPPTPTSAAPLSAANMLSPPTSAFPSQVLKSPASSTDPDSTQLWSEIETMNLGMTRRMGLTGVGVDTRAGGVVLGLPPVATKGPVKTVGGAEGELVLDQSQIQVSHFLAADSDLDVDTSRTGPIISTVGDLVGSSPDTSAALTERLSPILPLSSEEEAMTATGVLRAGEGVLGTKTHGQGEEEKNVEDGGDEGGRAFPWLFLGNSRDTGGEEGSNVSDYSDQEESAIHISKAPCSTDRLLMPDNHLKQRSREAPPARDQANRDSSRSSSSASTAETIARKKFSVRTQPVLTSYSNRGGVPSTNSPFPPSAIPIDSRHTQSPLNRNFENSSEESAGSFSYWLSPSSSQDNYPMPGTDSANLTSPLFDYLDETQIPSPLTEKMTFGAFPSLLPATATAPPPPRTKAPNDSDANNYDYNYAPGDDDDEGFVPFAYPDEAMVEVAQASMAAAASAVPPRPTIFISDEPLSAAIPTTATTASAAPFSPLQQHRGWFFAIVSPLEEFIDEGVDPRKHYLDLKEIAEGESGSVFSARLNPLTISKLRLPSMIKAKDLEEMSQHPEQAKWVAIKNVEIVQAGSSKLVDLQKELMLMKGLMGHENVLGIDGIYVDLVEDSLWLRMELMERSLAEMVGLVGDGLMLQDRMLARFASDVLSALEYLQEHSIAHRDVRSDNLLLNKDGFLKLADFSNAVQVTKDFPIRTDPAGVVYWQAPEVRKPPYNALKVDVWSLGATLWEVAQTEPPFYVTQQFGDHWPPLRQPELYSPAFHDFLRKCSEPALSRPNPSDLLKHPFVHNACGRPNVVHLLSQCMAIEESLWEGPGASP